MVLMAAIEKFVKCKNIISINNKLDWTARNSIMTGERRKVKFFMRDH